MSGRRVVLVAPRAADKTLAATLETIAAYGWQLVAVVDPEHHEDALRMIVLGDADAIIAARPEYVPSVMFTGDLQPPAAGPRNERTAMPPGYRDPRGRRPQPIG